MSVLTGIAPQSILDLDPAMYDAMVEAVGERWSVQDELMATQVELSHATYTAVLATGGVKRLPDVLRVPRPGDEVKDEKPRQISASEFLMLHGEK